MARFVFSMQNLLNMKEKLEEQEKNNYSRANMLYQEALDELEQIKARRQREEESLKQCLKETIDVREIRRREEAVEIVKLYIKQQQLVVMQREQEVQEAREKLAEAMKERKTFEKLREKAFQAFMEEENKKEQKEVDELVSYRYGVKTQQ